MFKRIIFFAISFIGLQAILAAHPVYLKGELAYFRPTSDTLRDIYGSHWLNAGFEISGRLPFTQPFLRDLYLFGGFNYLNADGNSIGGGDPTEIRIIPLSLGLNYVYTAIEGAHPLQLYLGAGLRYFFVRVKNNTSFVEQRMTKSGLGGVIQGGISYFIAKNVFLNGFIDYSFRSLGIMNTPKGVTGKGVEVGGLSIGGSLGFQF